MYGLSRLVALILAFALGFSCCTGILVGSAVAALATFKVRDLERHGLAQIPDELFMGDNPKVDLLDLNAFQLLDELKAIQKEGDNVTIDYVVDRYDLKINSKINSLLSPEARKIPIHQLFSEKGVHQLLSTVYIGHLQNYECHAIDSEERANPANGKEFTRWYDSTSGKYVSGIGATIAYFSLEDFASGNINVDTVLHDIVLADVLGYTGVEENGKTVWYDGNNQKVTGVMSVFAGCTIDEVGTKINDVKIGELIGYEEVEDGVWASVNEETGELEEVHGFMNVIANNNVNSLGGAFENLTIGDLIPEDERTGIFAILSPDTKLSEISTSVNDSISTSPLQFFMNQGLMTFDEEQQGMLDQLCMADPENKVKKVAPDSEDYEKYYKVEGMEWETDADGNYLIPMWRTVPLSESFSYIVGLLTVTPSLPDYPEIPEIPET